MPIEAIRNSVHFDNESWNKICSLLTNPKRTPKAIVAIARKMPR